MNSRTILLAVMSAVLLANCDTAAGCRSGWFGNDCRYKCHCARTKSCSSDGSCSRCKRGWFGPACQYGDLAFNQVTQPYAGDLTNAYENTCVTPSRLQGNQVTVILERKYLFTWLRVHIHASATDLLHHLEVFFGPEASLLCVNTRNASLDQRTLDIHCDVDGAVQEVTLRGEAVPYLCSVYISGGRNIALKQRTSQSSTYIDDYTAYTADKAVDGNTDTDFSRFSCSSTKHERASPRRAEWNVTFDPPSYTTRYVLYNRSGHFSVRLKKLYLQSFGKMNNQVFNYTDTHSAPFGLLTYTVIPDSMTSPVTLVNIQENNNVKILSLCEVEIYGETGERTQAMNYLGLRFNRSLAYNEHIDQVITKAKRDLAAMRVMANFLNSSCDVGKFGRDCEHDCWCAQGEQCFVSTGGCPSGCVPGFHGESCHTKCPIGLYGSACAYKCSQFCLPSNSRQESPCHHVTGACHLGCQSGYTGTACSTQCPIGLYGSACAYNCSQFCLTSNSSLVSPCNHVTGACHLGCQSGYTGKACSTLTSAGYEEWMVPIAGVVVCVLVLICLATVVIFLIRKRRLARGDQVIQFKSKTEEAIYETVEDSNEHVNGADVDRAIPQNKSRIDSKNPAPKQTEVQRSPDSRPAADWDGVYNNMEVVPSSTRVSLADLPHFLKSQDRRLFEAQFHEIPANESATTALGTSPENRGKNRYKNICTYMILVSAVLSSWIIFAVCFSMTFFITKSVLGYRSEEIFIAAQGPTKVILEDFIRMLWEQQVDKVVMLTNLVDDGKQKCERYWPEDGEMKVGEITVSLTTTQVFADYTIRRLQLKKKDQPTQNVTQFHFTAWPDRDIPTGPWGLVDFEQKVASYPTDKPIVVHCSAGVGRTGTFIALRNVMREAEETGHMDFFTAVGKLRQDRINMVQTVDQYIFLHRAALVAMLCIGTTVTGDDIRCRVETLETSSKSGETNMEAEFKAICCACDDDRQRHDGSVENPCEVYNNTESDSAVGANVTYRAILARENDDVGDYINAVLVPSVAKQNQQILTQLPRSSTVTDFWRLVTQYRVSMIVAFQTDLIVQDQTLGHYLPASDDQTLELSLFTIRTEPGPFSMYWKQQNVVINVNKDKVVNMSAVKAEEHQTTHLACRPQSMDPGFLLALMEKMRSLRSSQSGRILYCCRDGATYSGLACVLSLLLDRLDTDHRLTIPLVVGAVKAIRPQIVPTLDQYRLLYNVLLQYSENATEYSNIGSRAP